MTFLRALVMLLRVQGFRRLFVARVTSQGSDGVFQAALASHVLFNPEQNTDPKLISAAFAVVLLPYSIVGPFAGTLLDRWPRRKVIVVSQLARVVAMSAVAALIILGVTGPGFFLVVLLVFSVNRFILSGFSAALPHLIAPEDLVSGNAVAPTTGSVAFFAGIVVGGFISALGTDAAVALVAAAAALSAAWAARRLPFIGPDTVAGGPRSVRVLAAVARGLVEALRTLPRRARLLLVLVLVSRLPFGYVLMQTLLLFRGPFAQPGQQVGDVLGFGLAAAAAAAGFGLAAFVAPWLTHRWHPIPFAARMLALSAVAAVALAPWLTPWTVSATNFVVSFAVQTVKISTDTLLQAHVPDALLGRTFSLQDMMYNFGLVTAATLAAWTLPPGGATTWPFFAVAAVLGVLALALPGLWRRVSAWDARAPLVRDC
ncbi:MAG TPA: MFS transporter [Intrasporangium sp.]|uniref:MFS transporter n=1 Tax=Intrasporangium sp. TaxID=1925024 RepID=UPI002B46F24F|nr:MFS transporter [Intrasporangium sp.]HKX68838.1 MFS transporter [Intrasporangium sp.]